MKLSVKKCFALIWILKCSYSVFMFVFNLNNLFRDPLNHLKGEKFIWVQLQYVHTLFGRGELVKTVSK